MTQFIGEKKIRSSKMLDEKTPGGVTIVQVEFEDGSVEIFSQLMYQKIVSNEPCDLSNLRDKRVQPVVEIVLEILRDWGIKIGELPYFSGLLNRSLDFNTREALNELWSKWMPRPKEPDDVDLVTVDRVLRSSKKTLNDVIRDGQNQ